MMTIIKMILSFPIILLSCKCVPQAKMEKVQLDKVNVYLDLKEKGYTTVGAITHFEDLKKKNVDIKTLSNEDKQKLEEILNNTEKKKHHQTKFGINNIFCEIKLSGQNHSDYSIIIISIDKVKSMITDLTDMKNYVITNKSDLDWLQNFSEQIRKQ